MSKENPDVISVYFHLGDLLAGTMDMDTTEFGAYVLLLIAHYKAGLEGLDYEESRLARMSRLSPAKWNKVSNKVLSKFEVVGDEEQGQKIVQSRTLKEIKKIYEKSAKARASSLIRHNKGDANAKRSRSRRNANQKPESNNPPKVSPGGDYASPPGEDWEKALWQKLGPDIYRSWIASLFLENGYVYCENQFKATWVKDNYGELIADAIGETFIGFRVIDKNHEILSA